MRTERAGIPDRGTFPSGPWVGYYNYGDASDRHRMDLELRFHEGLIDGSGNDDVASFIIRGRYDGERLEVWWRKIYPGSHEVYYRGFRENRGIWGVWQIGDNRRGGFMIWPKGAGDGEHLVAHETEAAPVPAEVPVTPGNPRLAS